MAYSGGVFYVDLVSGSDTARTALTSCTASNPSGSITRINKTSHGLTTGAVVDLTLFSTWLNDAWKITVVDANNFDLDGAVWQATADTSGTATPRGGSSWSDAWLTITSGPTAARIQPGDEIRVSGTPKVGTGVNATFTSGSATVTLASALTKNIQKADTTGDWTASANITKSTNSTRKIGSVAMVMTPASGFTTGKVCYALVAGGGTQDFSAYEKISLWFRPTTNTIIAASTYKICLCSDTTGDTIVNELNIPATIANNGFHCFTLDYGAALGSSIQSVAIYANSDPGTTPFSFNNIVACNDFTHSTLFGWEDDCFYNVQSIDGTTVKIDSLNTATGGQGWYGTTGTAEMFIVSPTLFSTASSANTVSEAGFLYSTIKFIGGYDTGLGTITGRTYLAATATISGVGFASSGFTELKNFVIARFSTPITSAIHIKAENVVIASGNSVSFSAELSPIFKDCKFLNTGTPTAGYATFENCDFFNAAGASFTATSACYMLNCRFANSSSAYSIAGGSSKSLSVNTYFGPHMVLRNCVLADSTEVSITGSSPGYITSLNTDQTAGNNWVFCSAGTFNWQTSTKHDSEPGAWRAIPLAASATEAQPIRMKVGEFAVSASSAATFTAWVKKDHATQLGCKIKIDREAYNLPGITETTDTKADDTNWEQLSISFTPTEAGIVQIFFEAWYVSGVSNAYIGTVTCTQ